MRCARCKAEHQQRVGRVPPDQLRQFAIDGTIGDRKDVADAFAVGEFYVRSDVNVRSCDCFVLQSLYADEQQGVAEKTMRLLFFVGSLFDASASRVTGVVLGLSSFWKTPSMWG